MDIYKSSFLGLIAGCGILTWQQYRRQEPEEAKTPLLNSEPPIPEARTLAKKFTRLFLVVYMLVMGADWLQGPYVYALYRHELGFSERTVAALFTTGFLSGAISGYFVGSFADRFGRRTACLTFCVTYATSCLTILVPSLPALFVARTLGGLSTSLMYSAFESWMVTEFHTRKIDAAGTSLSSIFGIMTTLNSIVAITAGVFSEWLVKVTETKRAPFFASAGVLCVAFCVIRASWTENYGSNSTSQPSVSAEPNPRPLISALIFPRILTLGFASALFEGTMYLFVFFWTPALVSTSPKVFPLGLIFACFMASIMLGSLLFNLLVSTYQVILHARLLTIVFVAASSALFVPVFWKSEVGTFAAFCVFEGCVGVYYPCMGYLKGRFVEDGIRARVYGVLRIPLNIFVVVALAMTREGEAFRNTVFVVCSGLLIFTSAIFHYVISD